MQNSLYHCMDPYNYLKCVTCMAPLQTSYWSIATQVGTCALER